MFRTIQQVLQSSLKTVGSVFQASGVTPTNSHVVGLKVFYPLWYAYGSGVFADISKVVPQGLGSALDDTALWMRLARAFRFVSANFVGVMQMVDVVSLWHALDGDPYQYSHWLSVLQWLALNVEPAMMSQVYSYVKQFETSLIGFLITFGEQVWDYIYDDFMSFSMPVVNFISLIEMVVSPTTSSQLMTVPIGIMLGIITDVWGVSNPSGPFTMVSVTFYFIPPNVSGYGLYNLGLTYGVYTSSGYEPIGYNYNGITYKYWAKVVYFGPQNSYLQPYGQYLENFLINEFIGSLGHGIPYDIFYVSGGTSPTGTNIYNFAPNLVSAFLQGVHNFWYQQTYTGSYVSGVAFKGTNFGPYYVAETGVGSIKFQPNTGSGFIALYNVGGSVTIQTSSGSLAVTMYFGSTFFLLGSELVYSSSMPNNIVTPYYGADLMMAFTGTGAFGNYYYQLESGILTLSEFASGLFNPTLATIRPIIYDFLESFGDFYIAMVVLESNIGSARLYGVSETVIPSTGGMPALILTAPEVEVSGNVKQVNLTLGTQNVYGVYIDVGSGLYNALAKAIFTAISTVTPIGGSLYAISTSYSTTAVARPDYYVATEGHFAPISPNDMTSQYTPSGYYLNVNNAVYLNEGTYVLDVTLVDQNNNVIYNGSLSVQAQKPILYVPSGYGVYTSTGLVYTEFVPQVLTPVQTSKPSPVLALASLLLLTLIGYFGSMKK